jgi:hypothetical protein
VREGRMLARSEAIRAGHAATVCPGTSSRGAGGFPSGQLPVITGSLAPPAAEIGPTVCQEIDTRGRLELHE